MYRTQYPVEPKLFVFFGLIGALFLAPSPCLAKAHASAHTPAHAAPAPVIAQQTPEKFIQDLGSNAIHILVDTNLTRAQLDAEYRKMLSSSFDIETIGKYVMGPAWQQATLEQRQEYLKLFKESVIKIYGVPLRFYHGRGFQVNSARRQGDKDSVVSTEISHPNGARPTMVDWVVRRGKDGKLAIIDVIISGVSQSVMQRDEFASALSRDGGDMNVLLAELRDNARQGSVEEVAVQ